MQCKSKVWHGLLRTRYTWQGMLARCHNPNQPHFERYGGRGISVCNRWRDSFDDFLEDMGERPQGRTLDRIDNSGNYEPGNCRWATLQEQCANRRRRPGHVQTVEITIYGKTFPVSKWAAISGTKPKTIRDRKQKGWADKDCVFAPLQRPGRGKRRAKV